MSIDNATVAMNLDKPMSCLNLNASTFGEAIASQPTLLVFLRHFG